MNTGIKSNDEYCVFLSQDDIFFHRVDSKYKSIVELPQNYNCGNSFGNYGLKYNREQVAHCDSRIDIHGNVVDDCVRYTLYVMDMEISKLGGNSIDQIFELCKSLKYGNYYNIPERFLINIH